MTAAADDEDVVSKSVADESAHWYAYDGSPCYTVPKANGGGTRPTTLRDARKMDLAPGFSAVAKMLSTPQITKWSIGQAVEAADRLPRGLDEAIDNWVARVVYESSRRKTDAADAGTSIHAQIEAHIDQLHETPTSTAVLRYLRECVGDFSAVPERSFVSRLGYGTKIDLLLTTATQRWIIDIKTKEFDKTTISKLEVYREHRMQLAAGTEAQSRSMGPIDRHAILFVSRTQPGLAHLADVPPPAIHDGRRMFLCALKCWQIDRNYRPSWAEDFSV